MRDIEKIDLEIDHIEYAQSILNEKLSTLKKERDEPREDEFAKRRTTKQIAEFFKSHGYFIVSLNSGQRTAEHYDIAKHIWRSKEVLIPFIKSIPKHKTTDFVYPTDGISLTGINSISNLCNLLKEKKWITFEKLASGVKITPTLSGAQKCFVTYSWSEEITLYLIDKTLKDFTKKTINL